MTELSNSGRIIKFSPLLYLTLLTLALRFSTFLNFFVHILKQISKFF